MNAICEYLRCSSEFVKNRSDQRFCSKNCRINNWNFKNRLAVLAKNNTPDRKLRNMLSRAKCRAKAAGIPFELEHGDFSIPEVCPVLGIPLVYNRGLGRGYYPDSPSLDRLVPSRGYTKGNVRVISARANLLKNDATIEELTLVLEDLREICV